MNRTRLVKYLKYVNAWRRGDPRCDKMPDPKVMGIAIDSAILRLQVDEKMLELSETHLKILENTILHYENKENTR